MAISVPYNPIPEQTPAHAPTPEVHPAVLGEAFGTGVAQATEGLGRELAHVGDKIFQRAIALQDLQNQMEARNLEAQFINGITDIHAKYSANEGANLAAALPKYKEDLNKVGQNITASASNDMVRKLVGGTIKSQIGHYLFNGAGQAASGLRQAANKSIETNIEATKSAMVQFPDDDISFEQGARELRKRVIEQANIHGWDRQTAENLYDRHMEDARAQRVMELRITNPQQATQLMETYKGQLGKHAVQVESAVENKVMDVTVRNIATQAAAPAWETVREGGAELTMGEAVETARKRVQEELPGNDKALQAVTAQTETEFGRIKKIKQETQQGIVNTFAGRLTGNQGTQPRPTNKDELFLGDKKLENQFETLPNSIKDKIIKSLDANARQDYKDTPEAKARFREILGMIHKDPDQAKNIFIPAENMPMWRRDQLLAAQQASYKTKDKDPRVAGALSTIAAHVSADPTLFDNIPKRKEDETKYFQFVGTVREMLTNYRAANGKDMPDEEVKKMGAYLLQNVGTSWFNRPQQWQVPSEVIDGLVKEHAERGITLNRGQARDMAVKRLYETLFTRPGTDSGR